jgi:hypothetical protein
MDAKVTLSFDAAVIAKAKAFAAKQGISLSRFVEVLLRKATGSSYEDIEELPISEWVTMVAEGPVEYTTKKRGRKSMKDEFFKSRK